jgi:two-component system response regulator MprA
VGESWRAGALIQWVDMALTRPAEEASEAAERERPRVLLVDDDERLLAALERGLAVRGFSVRSARDAGEALPHLRWPSVVVLDIMMPGMDGIGFCQLVRKSVAVPILMLTARDSVPDRVAGLEAGADDYLVKPFDLEELVARLRALLRRARPDGGSEDRLYYADLALDRTVWEATRGGIALPLTAKEFRLLEYFMRFPGRVLTREEILTSVWGEEWAAAGSNVVDAHIANLREKLEAGGRPRLLQTVRGVGYVLRED